MGSLFAWWNLEADPLWLMNSRGGPPFRGAVCWWILEAYPLLGLYVDELYRRNPHLERGSASRDNFYGTQNFISLFKVTLLISDSSLKFKYWIDSKLYVLRATNMDSTPKAISKWQVRADAFANSPQYFRSISIYSWSIGHILEHEFFCCGRLGSQGSKEKKSGFEEFWATFEGGFFNFLWAKFFFKFF